MFKILVASLEARGAFKIVVCFLHHSNLSAGTILLHDRSTLIYAFQILVPVIQDGLGWKSVFYLFMLMVSHEISSKLYVYSSNLLSLLVRMRIMFLILQGDLIFPKV